MVRSSVATDIAPLNARATTGATAASRRTRRSQTDFDRYQKALPCQMRSSATDCLPSVAIPRSTRSPRRARVLADLGV